MDKTVEDLLNETGGILRGHFLLTSGKHSNIYFEKFRLIENPNILMELAKYMKKFFQEFNFDYVVGPTTGGAIIAYEVARQFGKKFLIAEKRDGKRVFARGVIPRNSNCIVVDDVLTTGGSFIDTVNAVVSYGGNVVAGSVLIDRSGGFDPGFPYKALYTVSTDIYDPSECPLCKEGIELIRPGGKR